MINIKNKVQLIGHLGAIPEVRTLESGNKHARFSMVTTERYTNDKGEKVEETQWHSIVCHGKIAEIVKKHCKKGSEVAVEGRLTHRTYTDKAGMKRYVTEVEITEFLLLDKQQDNSHE